MTGSVLPTLYKPGSKGEVREWSVHVKDDIVVVTHGVKDGKMQEKETKVSGKNIGKANETTPQQQAQKVAQSKWDHQKDRKGYGLTPEDAVLARMPMLAYDYHKHGHRITYPAGVQPKLDGIRALVTKVAEGDVVITSRTGRKFGADLSHIEEFLDSILSVGTTLDGELYCHGLLLEDISSAVQKTGENTPKIEYWVFDIADTKLDNGRRAGILNFGFEPQGPVRLVKTETILSEAEMFKRHKLFVDAGFEGVMVRNREGMYKFNRRSADLQKYKVFSDEEYPIVDIIPDKDGNSVFVLAGATGTFTSVMVGEKETNRKYLENKDAYIGSYGTIRYQRKFRDTGLPQFPTLRSLRPCAGDGSPLL